MTEEKQVKGQGGECEVIPFAKVQKAAARNRPVLRGQTFAQIGE